MKTFKEKLQLDELKHVFFLICAEFEVENISKQLL